jgi:hypothetical protein
MKKKSKKKKYSNKRIPDEVLFKIALRYEYYEDFIEEERSKYTILSKRKLLGIACAHMKKKDTTGENHPNFKHTNKDLTKKAARCKTDKEFREKYPSEYTVANVRGIFKEITTHFVSSNPPGENHANSRYTNKEMFDIALTCKDLSELIDKHYDVYQASRVRGIFKEITAHYPKQIGENHPHAKYKDAEIIENGSQYRTPYEFLKNDPNAYKRAEKRKLLDKIPFPDAPYVNSSAMEKELFDIVKNAAGNAKKVKDRKVKIEGKPYIKGFDIDIFVPGLNLGIEVDGAWWHSFECMRKQKAKRKWSDEDIRNYHEIKDAWFAAKGISILHIKEEDWNNNKQDCIDKCLVFLGLEQKKVA